MSFSRLLEAFRPLYPLAYRKPDHISLDPDDTGKSAWAGLAVSALPPERAVCAVTVENHVSPLRWRPHANPVHT